MRRACRWIARGLRSALDWNQSSLAWKPSQSAEGCWASARLSRPVSGLPCSQLASNLLCWRRCSALALQATGSCVVTAASAFRAAGSQRLVALKLKMPNTGARLRLRQRRHLRRPFPRWETWREWGRGFLETAVASAAVGFARWLRAPLPVAVPSPPLRVPALPVAGVPFLLRLGGRDRVVRGEPFPRQFVCGPLQVLPARQRGAGVPVRNGATRRRIDASALRVVASR